MSTVVLHHSASLSYHMLGIMSAVVLNHSASLSSHMRIFSESHCCFHCGAALQLLRHLFSVRVVLHTLVLESILHFLDE